MKNCVITLFGFTAVFCGCGSSEDEVTETVAPQEEQQKVTPGGETVVDTRGLELTAAQLAAVARNNDFAFNFVRAVSSTDDVSGKSFVVSPLSLTYVLGMVNAGASGQTGEELTTVLGFNGETRESVNELCCQLIKGAPAVDSKVRLRLADMVAVREGLQLHDDYSAAIAESYQASTTSLPFGKSEAVDYVNAWCSRQTEGVIPRIVDEFSSQTVLALLNAVYFKAPWSGRFDASATRSETFTREDGSTVELPMMRRMDGAYYSSGKDFATLGLPYGDGRHWRMYVLLPNEDKTVSDVLSQLTQLQWSSVKASLGRDASVVDVWLPRFSAENDLELNGVLMGMGLQSMFKACHEFDIFVNADVDPFVSLVRQRAAIEVSEEGTEAAAVTIAEMDSACSPDGGGNSYVPQFHATRPFVYIIQEETSGAIFFIGTYRG